MVCSKRPEFQIYCSNITLRLIVPPYRLDRRKMPQKCSDIPHCGLSSHHSQTHGRNLCYRVAQLIYLLATHDISLNSLSPTETSTFLAIRGSLESCTRTLTSVHCRPRMPSFAINSHQEQHPAILCLISLRFPWKSGEPLSLLRE